MPLQRVWKIKAVKYTQARATAPKQPQQLCVVLLCCIKDIKRSTGKEFAVRGDILTIHTRIKCCPPPQLKVKKEKRK